MTTSRTGHVTANGSDRMRSVRYPRVIGSGTNRKCQTLTRGRKQWNQSSTNVVPVFSIALRSGCISTETRFR